MASKKRSAQPQSLLVSLVVLAIVASSASVVFVSYRVSAASVSVKKVAKRAPIKVKPTVKTDIQKRLDAIRIQAPSLDVRTSPVPDLKVSALNLALPKLPGKGVMQNIVGKQDFSYKEPVEVPVPDIRISMPTVPSDTGTGSNTSGTSSSTGSSASEVNAQNCGQFSTMPSAQYCNMVSDANGAQLCQKCKAAGL